MKTTMTMTLTESAQDGSALANTCDIQSGSQVGGNGLQARKERKERKEKLTKSVLKKHLKYIVPEIKLALIKEPGVKLHSIHGPQEIERLIEPMKFYPEEHFVTFHLDAKFQVIGYNEVSKGTVSASLVHPREVFKAALLSNSTAIICAHNHPSGIVKPSNEDIETTKTLIRAGEILGVQVLDHVIVGGVDLYSLRENRPEIWA